MKEKKKGFFQVGGNEASLKNEKIEPRNDIINQMDFASQVTKAGDLRCV